MIKKEDDIRIYEQMRAYNLVHEYTSLGSLVSIESLFG